MLYRCVTDGSDKGCLLCIVLAIWRMRGIFRGFCHPRFSVLALIQDKNRPSGLLRSPDLISISVEEVMEKRHARWHDHTCCWGGGVEGCSDGPKIKYTNLGPCMSCTAHEPRCYRRRHRPPNCWSTDGLFESQIQPSTARP